MSRVCFLCVCNPLVHLRCLRVKTLSARNLDLALPPLPLFFSIALRLRVDPNLRAVRFNRSVLKFFGFSWSGLLVSCAKAPSQHPCTDSFSPYLFKPHIPLIFHLLLLFSSNFTLLSLPSSFLPVVPSPS